MAHSSDVLVRGEPAKLEVRPTPSRKLTQGMTRTMKDYQASLAKLRESSAESRLISDLATGNAKRKMFAKLAKRLEKLADDVECAMTVKRIDEDY